MVMAWHTILFIEFEYFQPYFIVGDLEDASETRDAWGQAAGSVLRVKFMKTDHAEAAEQGEWYEKCNNNSKVHDGPEGSGYRDWQPMGHREVVTA